MTDLPHIRLAKRLVKHEANPVLDVGKQGDWDEKNCGCFSVDKFNGRLHLYYMGSGNNNPWRIGLATSDDGIRWQRHKSNPVLPAGEAGSWDDRAVSMPYIVNDGKSLCMIYSGSGKGGGFGLAMSGDGVKWSRYGDKPLLRGIGGSMDPCLRKFDGQYTLWYCGKQGKSFRLFRATSSDGIKWTKHPQPVLPLGNKGEYDETSHAGPVVLKVDDVYYLFHLGGGSRGWKAGLATSRDGIHWTKSAANPILDVGGKNDWDGGSILSIDALWMNDRFHVWYAAHSLAEAGKPEHQQTIRIGYAVSQVDEKKPQGQNAAAAPAVDNPNNGANKSGRAEIDHPVKDFRLRDLMQDDPAFVRLSQFRGRQVVVLVSIQSRCPITWRYVERIGKAYQDYRDKGVRFLMIRSSETDSEDRIRRYAEDKNLDMPLLFDEGHKIADYFGTQGTPYFYVIDKQGVLRYEGIFDNNQVPRRVELKPETATIQFVRDALDSVLAGKPLKRKKVPIGST